MALAYIARLTTFGSGIFSYAKIRRPHLLVAPKSAFLTGQQPFYSARRLILGTDTGAYVP